MCGRDEKPWSQEVFSLLLASSTELSLEAEVVLLLFSNQTKLIGSRAVPCMPVNYSDLINH